MGESWEIDKVNFKDLEALNPQDVISRTGCAYDTSTGQYRINIWGYDYCVEPHNNKIYPKENGLKTYQDFFYIFILHYLLTAKKILPSGEWVSEKDLKGGEGFFRGPHTLPLNVITKRVGNDIEFFESLCKKLGGNRIDFADAAFSFNITPSIPVAVLYWQGDEDFPSEAKLLFDKTIEKHLALDVIFALAVEVCHAFSYS